MKRGHFILATIFFLTSVSLIFYFFGLIGFSELEPIPYYAASSLLRMSIAYFFALCFALSYGYIGYFKIIINWTRHAGLIGYDSDSEEIYLMSRA